MLQCFVTEALITLRVMLLLLSRFSRVRLCATPQTAAHQAPCPWDSPGKNTGVGCHFLLQCMKVKSESEAAQSCLTLSDPMDCSLPGSSVHGIFQVRVLEWGASAFSNCKNNLLEECRFQPETRLTWIRIYRGRSPGIYNFDKGLLLLSDNFGKHCCVCVSCWSRGKKMVYEDVDLSLGFLIS